MNSVARLGLRRSVGLLLAALLAASLVLISPPQQAHAAAAYPVLKSGSAGSNITALQYLLGQHSLGTTADGAYGPKTKSAVVNFQQKNGLAADGVAGPKTWSKIVVTVKKGAKNDAVKAVQTQLKKHGHELAVDGDFGAKTDDAVRAFQKKNSLKVDGVVGAKTWVNLVGTGGGNDGGGGGGGGDDYDSLTADQLKHSRTIIGVGKGADIPEYGWVIALATAMQESRIRNLTHGDRDSQGLFQQRPSQGWGSLGEITDPAKASKAFYGVANHTNNPGLTDIGGWQDMSVTVAAQKVQRSAYPDAYAKWESLAREIVKKEKDNAPAIN